MTGNRTTGYSGVSQGVHEMGLESEVDAHGVVFRAAADRAIADRAADDKATTILQARLQASIRG